MKNYIPMLALSTILFSCSNENTPSPAKAVSNKKQDDAHPPGTAGIPFIGKRDFELRPGYSGAGTAHRMVEITSNGDVFFSFGQINQADGTETEERYYAGKYQRNLKCFFAKWENETTYYELTADTIYELDSHYKRMQSEECCDPHEVAAPNCPCKSELTVHEE